MNRDRKTRWLVLEWISLALLVLLSLLMIRRLIAWNRIMDEERAAAGLRESVVTAEPPFEPIAAPTVQPAIQELQDQNKDAVGLLHFGEDHTLYVCQSTDNAYYMTHRFDGSEDPAGMIYMDYRNTLFPRSDNLILYGHNMRNGSRFGTLGHYLQKEYLRKYPLFQFADACETADYVPFAIFHTSADPDAPEYFAFDRVNFSTDDDFTNYVREVRERSVLKIPLEASPGDRLLTLATCSSELDHGRLVIVCRAVREGERF